MNIPGNFKSGQFHIEAIRLAETKIVNGIVYQPGDWRLILGRVAERYEKDEDFRNKWEPTDPIAREMWRQ